MPKSYLYRELIKKLKKHDSQFFVVKREGKGSHRILRHPNIKGKRQRYTLPYHGEKTIIRQRMIIDIKRRFNLPSDVL